MTQEINLLLELDEYQEWIFSVVPSSVLKSRIANVGSESFKKIKTKFSEETTESCGKCSEKLHINLYYFDELVEGTQFDENNGMVDDDQELQAWEPECIIDRQDSYEVKQEPPEEIEEGEIEVDFYGFDETMVSNNDYDMQDMTNLPDELDEETIRTMPIPKSEDKNDPKPYKCVKCKMGFVAQKNVRRHLKNKSCKFPSQVPAPVIAPKKAVPSPMVSQNDSMDYDMTDPLNDTLNDEQLRLMPIPKSTEEDDKKPFKCPKCNLGFVAQKNVRRHLKNNSCRSIDILQGLRPYMCPNCKMRFTTRNNTKKHIRRNACGALNGANGTEPVMVDELSADPKPFKCPECKIGFSCRKNVERHLSANCCSALKGSFSQRNIESVMNYLPKDLVLPDLSTIKPPFNEAFEQPDGTYAYVSFSAKNGEIRVTNFDPNSQQCELCHKILKSPPDMLMHRRFAHFFPKNTTECAGCGKIFEVNTEKRLHAFYCPEKFNIISNNSHSIIDRHHQPKLDDEVEEVLN